MNFKGFQRKERNMFINILRRAIKEIMIIIARRYVNNNNNILAIHINSIYKFDNVYNE